MADVRWPATTTASADPVAPLWGRLRAAMAPLRKLKAQRPADGIGLGEPKGQPLADAIGLAGLFADELPRSLVVAEIFLPERLRENQPVAAEILDRGEEAERLHPGDPAFDQLADLIRQIGGDIAIDRLTLRLHRAPLEHRDLLPDLHEAFFLAL